MLDDVKKPETSSAPLSAVKPKIYQTDVKPRKPTIIPE